MKQTRPSPNLMRRPMRRLTTSLDDAMRGQDATALHQARVASRRLREVLPVAAHAGAAQKLQRRIRKITRSLGPVRELDVSAEILDDLRTRGVVSAAALAPLRRALTAEREARWADLRHTLSRSSVDKLRRRAAAADGGLDPQARVRLLPRAWERAGQRALRVRAAVDLASGLYLPDRLHEVRIAVKKLRYALEVVQALGRAQAPARMRALRQAQDLLGRMHDIEVLIARIRTVQGTPGKANLRVSADLDRAVRALEIECRQRHGKYVATRDALVQVADAVVRSAWRVRGA